MHLNGQHQTEEAFLKVRDRQKNSITIKLILKQYFMLIHMFHI